VELGNQVPQAEGTIDMTHPRRTDCAFFFCTRKNDLMNATSENLLVTPTARGQRETFSISQHLPWPSTELAIVGKSLLNSQHSEFTSRTIVTPPTDVQRGVYGQITIKF